MQHISHKLFKCAGINFEQKLENFHDWHSREHSQETRIPTYKTFETEVERVYLPVICNEGMRVPVRESEREHAHAVRSCVCVEEREAECVAESKKKLQVC